MKRSQSPAIDGPSRGVVAQFPVTALIKDLRTDLHAHRRQVVAARKIIDFRAQRSPVTFCLCAVFPFRYDLVDAARAVHDLLHLRFCLQIIRRWIELGPKSIRGAIQIVHSVFEIVFCFRRLVPRASVSAEFERWPRVVAPLLWADCVRFLASSPRFPRYFSNSPTPSSTLRMRSPTCAFVNGFV